jgi:(2Fe-2S) ferredoxin
MFNTMRIFLIAFILLSFACKSKKDAAEKLESKEESTEQVEQRIPLETDGMEETAKNAFPKNAIARIQRTACFGRCPIYTLTVYKDGIVIYEAEKWVEKEGTFQTKVDQKVIQQLMKKAESVNYFGMKNVYDSAQVTDLPSTITSLRTEDQLKIIVNRFQGPEELAEFEKYFDELFLKLNWSEQDSE